jgi:succinoglycan biosynthesis transport protein ExoP
MATNGMALQPQVLQQQPEPEGEFNISQWIEIIKRRRNLLFLVCGVVLAGSLLLYATTPKSYRATTTIQIERRLPGPMRVEDVLGFESYWDAESFYPTQFRLLQSRGLAAKVVRDLRLLDDPYFNPSRNRLFAANHVTTSTAADDEAAMVRAAQRIQAGLSINPIRNTRLVEISFVAPAPRLAARVANGVAQAYIEWGIETRGASVDKASSFLAGQTEALKQEIQNKEAQLQAYSRRSDIVALDPGSNVIVQRLEALNRDYTGAVSDRINKEAKYRELTNAPMETVADTLSGGLVGQLRSDVLKLEQEYASKLATYKPEWPAMQDLKAQIDKSRQNLAAVVEETVQKARDAARADYQTALRREQSLADELDKQKAQAMQLNSAAVEYNNLKVEVSTRRALLDELLKKQSETEVASRLQGSRESNVVVVDKALVPGGPYRPSLRRNLFLGLALGLGLGLGVVFLVEHLDRSIKSPEDVDRVLGLPLLGVVPDISAGKGGYGYYGGYYGSTHSRSGRRKGRTQLAPEIQHIELICESGPRLAVSEAYRSARTALLLSSGKALRSLVVTSARMGEGKTATTGNLGVVLSQLGRQVLIIDGDLRKPRQHEIFKVSNRVGLVSYLAGQADPADIVQRTPIPDLYVTPSGPIPPNPAELLASDRMREFLSLAQQRFDLIVIDSSPVLPVTDAVILSGLVDGVVLCLGAGLVLREDALTCAERLTMVDSHILGVILNAVRQTGSRYYKSYYRQYKSHLDDAGEAAVERRVAG